jgi:hypothetical protein
MLRGTHWPMSLQMKHTPQRRHRYFQPKVQPAMASIGSCTRQKVQENQQQWAVDNLKHHVLALAMAVQTNQMLLNPSP